jgi:menaquinone-dependent protoporphyrinogen oxidase
MHVLVAYGSKMGGTAGIAELIGDALTDAGLQADVRPVAEVSQLDRYDAVVIGGALYSGHWHRQARRFLRRHTDVLRQRPVWLFSSGPLNGSAAEEIPPVPQVEELARRIGARGHATFGGRLPADAKGSQPARWPRPTPATGATPSTSGAGRPMWRWSCCRLTSWTVCMPNRLTKQWNGRRPPKGELWP